MRRRRSKYSGSTTIHGIRPLIFWDQAENSFVLKVPPNKEFNNDLQLICEGNVRAGGGEGNVWFFTEIDLDRVKTCIEAHFPPNAFGSAEFIGKPDPNKPRSNGHVSAGGKAALTMFSIGGYPAAKKVYSLLIKQFHPDYNPDPAANAKAQEITLAWREIKKELNW